MVEIYNIFVCWQFLLASIVVFVVVALFNGIKGWKGVGHYLWKLGASDKLRWVRKILKGMEAAKVPIMVALGFGYGWIPDVPRPEPLVEASALSLAMLYAVAGLLSVTLVKAVKKYIESKGIDIDLDLDPKQQKRAVKGKGV